MPDELCLTLFKAHVQAFFTRCCMIIERLQCEDCFSASRTARKENSRADWNALLHERIKSIDASEYMASLFLMILSFVLLVPLSSLFALNLLFDGRHVDFANNRWLRL